MSNKNKTITVICSLILGVAVALAVLLGTLIPKMLEAKRTTLVFISDSVTMQYSGNALFSSGWKMTEGELKGGHTAEVRVTGRQEIPGQSENHMSVIIRDEGGRDVSDEYNIVLKPGILQVTLAKLEITTPGDTKMYDGKPLEKKKYELTGGTSLPAKHELVVEVTGEQTKVGQSPNTVGDISVFRINEDGERIPVKDYFDITCFYGMLTVTDGREATIGGYGKPDDTPIYTIYSNASAPIYLKQGSYGIYTGTSWMSAGDYEYLTDDGYSAAYLASMARASRGDAASAVNIIFKGGPFVMPYYSMPGGVGAPTQLSDSFVDGLTDKSVTYSYYADNNFYSGVPAELAAYERDYRSYVYKNYLGIDSETLEFMKGIISSEGLDKSSPDIINEVASYVRGAAKYNLEYNPKLDKEENMVVAFLGKYGEGVCRHYASAAVLLYRALGIPARYTVGAAAETVAGESMDVLASQMHAWAEVYVDGVGWVFVEVTGGSGGSGPPVEDDGTMLGKLVITPIGARKQYDGTPLYYSGNVFIKGWTDKFVPLGYTYEYVGDVLKNMRTEPGKTKISLTKDDFIIRDSSGANVTDKFEFEFKSAELHVYLDQVYVTSGNASKIYDGVSFGEAQITNYTITENLPEGFTVSVRPASKVYYTSVGKMNNEFSATVYDAGGNNVTDCYWIRATYGTLNITPRGITVRAGSAEAVFEDLRGEALTCYDYEIVDTGFIENRLADGDRVFECTIVGSQLEPGRSDNIIKTVIIVNSAGDDVTSNYNIGFEKGQLRVY